MAEVVETVLEDMARRLPPPPSPAAAAARAYLDREWAEIVGPRFAGLLRPGPVSTQAPTTLIVWAKHSVALFEARQQLRDLAERIRRRVAGAPWTSVQFRLEPTDVTEPPGAPG